MKTNTNQEFSVANSSSAVYTQLVTVGVLKNAGSNLTDIVTATTGSVFVAQSPETFTHDADGNLLTDGRWTYSWDAENRLIGAESVSGLPSSVRRQKLVFGYDSQSRRISKVVSNWTGSAWAAGTHLKFLYDAWNLVAELNQTNAVVRSYTWGLDLSGSPQGAGGIGGLLLLSTLDSQPSTHFVSYDGNGNVAALLSADSGSLTASYEYSPFGETLRATGPMAKANPFRFSTKYQDQETGLLYYGYRYYQPSTGRWANYDPLPESASIGRFLFADNNPITQWDFLGLTSYGSPPPVGVFPVHYLGQSGGSLYFAAGTEFNSRIRNTPCSANFELDALQSIIHKIQSQWAKTHGTKPCCPGSGTEKVTQECEVLPWHDFDLFLAINRYTLSYDATWSVGTDCHAKYNIHFKGADRYDFSTLAMILFGLLPAHGVPFDVEWNWIRAGF